MAKSIENLKNAFDEMFDFIADLPSGLDGFESDFDSAFEELRELKATLTPPNEWVSVEERLPPEHEPVLCIVNGKPKPNITLEEAYQLGSWNKADGWIIDEYLDWEDAVVLWWMPLPEPPGKEG